jgi:hypothetical protein
MKSPVRVDLASTEVESALLGVGLVPVGTYDSLEITFANPQLTILNNSGSAINNCPNGAVCELTPMLSTSVVTLSGASFPVNVEGDTATVGTARLNLSLDFNLMSSISSTFTTVAPSVTLGKRLTEPFKHLPIDFQEMLGQVTQVDPPSNLFGDGFPSSLILRTTFGDFKIFNEEALTQLRGFGPTCRSNDFGCIVPGQILQVEPILFLDIFEADSWFGSRITLQSDVQHGLLEGVITSIPDSAQFEIVLLNEAPNVVGVAVGNHVRVNLASMTTLVVDSDDLPVSGLSFSTASDLLVGQHVRIRLLSRPSGTPPAVDTDRITLIKGPLTAQVGQVLNAEDFTLVNLPALYSGQSVIVHAGSATLKGASSLADLHPGDTVSVSGLLFKTLGNPALVAARVRKR